MKHSVTVLLVVGCVALAGLWWVEHQRAGRLADRVAAQAAEASNTVAQLAEARRTSGLLKDAVARAEEAEADLKAAQDAAAQYEAEAARIAALPAPRVMVALRDGTKLTGEIARKDSTSIVLRTQDGTRTVEWRSVAPATMMTLDPDLYNDLKTLAEQRARSAKSAVAAKVTAPVEVKGQWLAKVSLGVDASEGCKVMDRSAQMIAFNQDRKNPPGLKTSGTKYSTWAKIEVKVAGLMPAEQHTLRIAATCYRKALGPAADEKDTIEKSEVLSGNDEYAFEYRGTAYDFFKSGRNMAGFQNDGFDIKVWIDDTLVYEQKRNARGEHFIVGKR